MTKAGSVAKQVLTVDIGGTKINAALVTVNADASPRLSEVLNTHTPAQEGAEAVVQAALDLASQVLAAADSAPDFSGIDLVGIASAGVIDAESGTVTAATDALPGWVGTDLAAAFSSRFGVPAFALNDVHAHGMGEAAFGAGKEQESLLLLAIGTGIGGAFIENGKVHTGVHGAAGHLGHIPAVGIGGVENVQCSCGRFGHLEGIASGPGIAAELTRRAVAAANTREVAALANSAGDSVPKADESPANPAAAARQLLNEVGTATGRAIGAFLNAYDPKVVALTGGVASMSELAGEIWWEALLAGVKAEAMDVVANTPVVSATAGNYAALLGAAANAIERSSN